jgi:HEPN domain-containing protein
MNSHVQYWLDLSDYDMETAHAMFETKRFIYVGFMCHLTIEKALKAWYTSENESTAPYTHNLARLAEQTGVFHRFSDAQKAFLDLLEPLNIQTRYPTHKDKLTKALTAEVCEDLLGQTKELQTWIKQQLSKS